MLFVSHIETQAAPSRTWLSGDNAVAKTNKPASQTVDRAMALLRLVAGASAEGIRLADLATV